MNTMLKVFLLAFMALASHAQAADTSEATAPATEQNVAAQQTTAPEGTPADAVQATEAPAPVEAPVQAPVEDTPPAQTEEVNAAADEASKTLVTKAAPKTKEISKKKKKKKNKKNIKSKNHHGKNHGFHGNADALNANEKIQNQAGEACGATAPECANAEAQ
jgi:outer membrane biosynthesis protein TonB